MISGTEEPVHTADAGASGGESVDGSGGARGNKQLSVLELVRRDEQRKGARSAPGEYLHWPAGDMSGAKRSTVRSASAAKPVYFNPDCMRTIDNMIESAKVKVILAFNEIFETLQSRLTID